MSPPPPPPSFHRCLVFFFLVGWTTHGAFATVPPPLFLRHRTVGGLRPLASPLASPLPPFPNHTDPSSPSHLVWVHVDRTVLPTSAAIAAAVQPLCTALPHPHQGHTFACWIDPRARTALRRTPGVVGLTDVVPQDKYTPSAPWSRATGVTVLLLPSRRIHPPAVRRRWYRHQGISSSSPSPWSIRRAGTWAYTWTRRRTLPRTNNGTKDANAANDMLALARHVARTTPEAYWLEPYVPPTVHNVHAVPWMVRGAFDLQAAAAAAATTTTEWGPYDGTNVPVAIGDTGCDVDHCAFGPAPIDPPPQTTVVLDWDQRLEPPYDPWTQVPPAPHLAPPSAKIAAYVRYVFPDEEGGGLGGGSTEPPLHTDFVDAPGGHGTHVCGTAVGHHGMAPGSPLVFLDLGLQHNPSSEPPGSDDEDNTVLFVPPDVGHDVVGWLHTHTNVRILSLSFGTDVAEYTELARQLDEACAHYDDMVVVVAAGNTGRLGTGTIGSPATAKNIVAVGASYNTPHALAAYRHQPQWFADHTYPYGPSMEHAVDPTVVAGFSARGPTADGRQGPLLVAPGTPLVSARSGTACDRMALDGTSMAAPLVAGMVARIRGRWPTASSALVKSALVAWTVPVHRVVDTGTLGHTVGVARSVRVATVHDAGYGAARLGPIDRTWTWDRVDAVPHGRVQWQATGPTDGADGSAMVALAWTDPPAALGTHSALVHDLDLDVLVTTAATDTNETVYLQRYLGNDRPWPDRRNNVEAWRDPTPYRAEGSTTTTWTITVRTVHLTAPTQPFALTVVVPSDTWSVEQVTAPSAPCAVHGVNTPPVPCVYRTDPTHPPVGGGTQTCTETGHLGPCRVEYCDDNHYLVAAAAAAAATAGDDGADATSPTCALLPCDPDDQQPCAVAHGTGRTCGSMATVPCVPMRCHTGYVVRATACAAASAAAAHDDDDDDGQNPNEGSDGTKHWVAVVPRDTVRPGWGTLLLCGLLVAGVVAYARHHCGRHHHEGPVSGGGGGGDERVEARAAAAAAPAAITAPWRAHRPSVRRRTHGTVPWWEHYRLFTEPLLQGERHQH